MKKNGFFCLFALAGLLLTAGEARAQHFDPAHRHSIEITSGQAPLRATMFGPDNFDSSLSWEYDQRGQAASVDWCPSINLAYAFAIDERWELHVIANYSLMRCSVRQYPAMENVGMTTGEKQWDWHAKPVSVWKENIKESVAVMVDLRWKWFRWENGALYSALGAGLPIVENPVPTPYITPIGVRIGGKHVYGLAELNLSSAATLGLAGIGIRF